jgi:hypothetical protein
LKSKYKAIKYPFIIAFIIIIICGIYIKNSNILHVVDKVYSPDKKIKQVVYINKNDGSEKDNVHIKIYDDKGRSNTSISFSGQYGGIFWTSDSSKYVIKAKDYISNIYVVDKNSGGIEGIDIRLDLALQSYIKENPGIINFTIDENPIRDYEFIQWEKDTETMLVYYEIDDKDKNTHKGYFLFDTKKNEIMGMLPSA